MCYRDIRRQLTQGIDAGITPGCDRSRQRGTSPTATYADSQHKARGNIVNLWSGGIILNKMIHMCYCDIRRQLTQGIDAGITPGCDRSRQRGTNYRTYI